MEMYELLRVRKKNSIAPPPPELLTQNLKLMVIMFHASNPCRIDSWLQAETLFSVTCKKTIMNFIHTVKAAKTRVEIMVTTR